MAKGRRKKDESEEPGPVREPVKKKHKTLSDLFQRTAADSGSNRPSPSKRPTTVKASGKKKAVVEVSSDDETEDEILELSEGIDEASEGIKPPSSSSPHVATSRPTPKRHPAKPAPRPATTATNDDRLWCDKHRPSHPSELAVHPKKVQQVRNWLREAFDGPQTVRKYRKLLVLSGPAGSGKTAVVKALGTSHVLERAVATVGKGKAKASASAEEESGVGYEVLEWSTAEGRETSDEPSIFKFRAWLARASTAPTLSFTSTSSVPTTIPLPSASSSRTLLLVEDLPNVSHPDTRDLFLSSLTTFLSTSSPFSPPMVLIVSESTTRPGDEGFSTALSMTVDSFSSDRPLSAFSLLPKSILENPKASQVKFNPVSATLLKKLVGKVVDAEWTEKEDRGRKSKKVTPTAKEVEELVAAAGGDLRSAINGLQFLALHGKLDSSGKAAKKRGKAKAKEDVEGPPVAGREASLIIFHSLGKVLYNKRWGQDPDEDRKDKRYRPPAPGKLPQHLGRFDRPQLKTDVDSLFSDTSVSTDIFTAYLHHNFPGFCVEVEEADSALEHISLSDSLMALETSRWTAKPLTSLYSFHVVSRGMLMSLPSPVPRKGQKLYKPETWAMRDRSDEHVAAVDAFRAAASSSQMEGGEGTARLPRTTVATELMPWIGVIGRHDPSRRNPLTVQLTTFRLPQLAGDTLDEEDDGADDKMALDEDEKTGPAKVQEVVGVVGEEADKDGELWFEAEDDIASDED